MQTVDQRIYRMLHEQEVRNGQNNQNQSQYGSAFIAHVVFKAIAVGVMLLRGLLLPLIKKLILIQIILLCVVIDFWLTKNVTGKKMIGTRWGLEQNQFGDQKFQFEGRVNQQIISPLHSKLFWLVQGIYVVAAVVLLAFSILSNTFSFAQNLDDLLVYLAIFLGGAINLYFFMRATRGLGARRGEMQSRLGNQFMGKLGLATIVSYL